MRDEGRRTKDEGRGTRDEGRGTHLLALHIRLLHLFLFLLWILFLFVSRCRHFLVSFRCHALQLRLWLCLRLLWLRLYFSHLDGWDLNVQFLEEHFALARAVADPGSFANQRVKPQELSAPLYLVVRHCLELILEPGPASQATGADSINRVRSDWRDLEDPAPHNTLHRGTALCEKRKQRENQRRGGG